MKERPDGDFQGSGDGEKYCGVGSGMENTSRQILIKIGWNRMHRAFVTTKYVPTIRELVMYGTRKHNPHGRNTMK